MWSFFCKDLGLQFGDVSGKEAYEKALTKFEDHLEDRLEDLCAGDAYITCTQTASILWTYSFWVTHYVYVRSGYAMRRLPLDAALQSSLVKACLLLASIEDNRQAPDCLAELVQCLLLVNPNTLKELLPHIERLLEMELGGDLTLETSLDESRQVLHGRFVYLLALGTFLVVARRSEDDSQ